MQIEAATTLKLMSGINFYKGGVVRVQIVRRLTSGHSTLDDTPLPDRRSHDHRTECFV